MSPALFNLGDYELHSGARSPWKIDCDALTEVDLRAIAVMLVERLLPFGSVVGVPRGGLRLAEAMRPYATHGPCLIVDDVLTTGASMEQHRTPDANGAVIFARRLCPPWITPLFQMERP